MQKSSECSPSSCQPAVSSRGRLHLGEPFHREAASGKSPLGATRKPLIESIPLQSQRTAGSDSQEALQLCRRLPKEAGECGPSDSEIFESRSSGYFVDGYFLRGASINALMRACLNDWMMGSAEEHFYSRQTYALASYYVDSYLLRKATLGKADLQLVGFTALFLASKLEESHSPKTLPCHITREEVYRTEFDICQKLEYRLMVDTYVHWLSAMTSKWDSLATGTVEYHHTLYLQPSKQSYQRYCTLFQLADAINLDSLSYCFDRKQLMFNLFCLVTFCSVRLWNSFPANRQSLVEELLADTGYISYMVEAMQSICTRFKVESSMLRHICQFLELQICQTEPTASSEMYSQFLSLQTHNPAMFPLIRQLVASRKFK